MPSLERRVEQRVERIPFSDCVYWVGNDHHAGRGRIKYNNTCMAVYKAVWVNANGPIPTDKEVIHTCTNYNNSCVALHHLELKEKALKEGEQYEYDETTGELKVKKCPESVQKTAGQRYLELQSDTNEELYDFICNLEAFIYVKQQEAFGERMAHGAERHKAARNALCDGKAFSYEVIGIYLQEYFNAKTK